MGLEEEIIRIQEENKQIKTQLTKLETDFINKQKEFDRREQMLLTNNVKKREKENLKYAIDIGKNFEILFYNMPIEEQQKILNYCYKYAPIQVDNLSVLFGLK